MPFMKFIPSVYELKLTTISLYTDTSKEMKVGVGTVFNYSATTLYNRFVSEFRTEIYDHKISIELIVPPHSTLLKPSEIRLNGIFYWDDIPVTNLRIKIDDSQNKLLSIKATLFTFYGNSYKSNLEAIQTTAGENSISHPLFTNNEQSVCAHFPNAYKLYKIKEDDDVEISLQFFNSDKKPHWIDVVLPLECRPQEGQRQFNDYSCPDFYKIGKNKLSPSHFSFRNASLNVELVRYDYALPCFFAGHPVEKLSFVVENNNINNCRYIELKLVEAEKYTVEALRNFLYNELAQYNEDIEVTCEGVKTQSHYYTIDDDRIVRVFYSPTN